MFDYKLYSNQFSCRLFSQQVSRKIAVIDIKKKIHTVLEDFILRMLSALKEAIGQICFVKMFSLKISQNHRKKTVSEFLFKQSRRPGTQVLFCEFFVINSPLIWYWLLPTKTLQYDWNSVYHPLLILITN